jgi:arginine decarboxylase-like protein
MELLETQDPEKKKLIETSDRHKHELEKEVKAISEKTERAVKNALIIGGALAVTYLVFNQLSSSKKKKKKTKEKANTLANTEEEIDDESASAFTPPTFLSQIGERIAAQATVMLLDIAKAKLAEYLETRKEKVENENT